MKLNSCITRWFALLLVILMLLVVGCSSDSSGSGNGITPPDDTPSQLSIGVSSASVKTDNSDSLTITASVLNEKNVAIEGVTVTYSATGGALSSGSAVTDEDGLAKVNFSSGLNDKSNRQVTVEAKVTDLPPAQVPIQILGTTVKLTSLDSTSLTIGGDNTDRLLVAVTDASELPIFNTPVSITLGNDSSGTVTFSPTSGATDVNGEATITIAGATPGDAVVNVSAAGAIASQSYLVQATEEAFGIISPTKDPASMAIGEELSIIVQNPTPGSSNTVVFATTIGTFTSGANSGSAINVPVVGGRAQALLSSTEAGVSSIQVFDADDTAVTDKLKVAIFAPSNQASKIALQASNRNVAPSSVNITNNVTIFATVTNAMDQVVGEAPVLFTLSNPTGGGEAISPTIAYTDNSGVATTTFTSGSLSSDSEGVVVTGQVLGSENVSPDSINIIIGGTAGAVSVGTATKVATINDDTAYELPVSVIVSDSNGNPIPGAQVSLSLWPLMYATGVSVTDPNKIWHANEDDPGRNLVLDPGEDINGDKALTPNITDAGTIPGTVVTDENGLGTFKFVYLKDNAGYIVFELTASTLVLGSETSSAHTGVLPWAVDDEPFLGPSPFN